MNILRALDDAQVFRPFFGGDTWGAWRAFLAALFALPMTAEQTAIYQTHTGRSAPPGEASHEAWLSRLRHVLRVWASSSARKMFMARLVRWASGAED